MQTTSRSPGTSTPGFYIARRRSRTFSPRAAQDLFEAPGNPQLRVALHHGPVHLARGEASETILVSGSAVQLAARIEPHVRPGEIWATDAFRTRLEAGPTLYAATEIAPAHGERSGGPAGAESMFNVKKAGSPEPDIWVRLYRLMLSSLVP